MKTWVQSSVMTISCLSGISVSTSSATWYMCLVWPKFTHVWLHLLQCWDCIPHGGITTHENGGIAAHENASRSCRTQCSKHPLSLSCNLNLCWLDKSPWRSHCRRVGALCQMKRLGVATLYNTDSSLASLLIGSHYSTYLSCSSSGEMKNTPTSAPSEFQWTTKIDLPMYLIVDADCWISVHSVTKSANVWHLMALRGMKSIWRASNLTAYMDTYFVASCTHDVAKWVVAH